jgi:hypothetical protein
MALSIIKSSPIFKLNVVKYKKRKKKKIKETPAFIKNINRRTSLAIKFIIHTIRQKKLKKQNDISNEILNILRNDSETINKKNTLQKQILKHKHYFSFYKWK